jgi:hypothetical protein
MHTSISVGARWFLRIVNLMRRFFQSQELRDRENVAHNLRARFPTRKNRYTWMTSLAQKFA